jgi:hypothetical protein
MARFYATGRMMPNIGVDRFWFDLRRGCPPKRRAGATKAIPAGIWFCRGLFVPRSSGRSGHAVFQTRTSPERVYSIRQAINPIWRISIIGS